MARIEYPDPLTLPDDLRSFMAKMPDSNSLRMLCHASTAARPAMSLGSALIYKTSLDALLRELVILRVGHLCQATYSISQHKLAAKQIGVPDKLVAATQADHMPAVFNAKERAVLELVDDVVITKRATSRTFASVVKHLTNRQLLELLLTIGYYVMFAGFLNTLEIDPETELKLYGLSPAAQGGSKEG